MRRLVLAALILSALAINPTSSDAASRRGYNRKPQTFFGQLMELERRKNAWLMNFFFGS